MDNTIDLEPAIPSRLQKDRTTSLKCPRANYIPPFSAYATRFPEQTTEIVMAVIGVQEHSPAASPSSGLTSEIAKISSFFTSSPSAVQPSFWEPNSYIDATGAPNIAIIAYWASTSTFENWKEESGYSVWWGSLDPSTLPFGYWMEVFSPSVDRLETVLSRNDIKEGAGHLGEKVSGEVREHGYWGGVRDRLPVAQTEELAGQKRDPSGEGEPEAEASITKRRIVVPARKNLCVIRSGQDWSKTSPSEWEMYEKKMYPVLIKGMDFLRDEGASIGCYSCRFMKCLVPTSPFQPDVARTFGLAYFDELASLEDWSKRHKTHADIFGGFLKYAKEVGDGMGLRLWHEVLVLEKGQQWFEYVGCHEGTGMLAAR